MLCQYKGKVLTIAGSDSSGGAGIQADIKTITMLGCYAASCITSVTVQDTTKVYSAYDLPIDTIREQIKVVLSDIGIDSVKIGMLSNKEIVEIVDSSLPKELPIIFDPVMVSTTGFQLYNSEVIFSFKNLIKKSVIVTPNIPEAEVLSNTTINNLQDMISAGKIILSYGANSVLVKGGHLPGQVINNVFMTTNDVLHFSHERVTEKSLHGTGCALSSAIASFIAQKLSVRDSVNQAIKYVIGAIKNCPKIGYGYSPIFHNYLLLQQ